jgi:hypothetical protein
MKTSKTIKGAQRNPPAILDRGHDQRGNLTWLVEGNLSPQYLVTRTGENAYRCGCPTPFGLCHHIQAAVKDLAAGKWAFVSFWTNQHDAERQKRRVVRMTGNSGWAFWVTLPRRLPKPAPAPKPEPLKAPREAVVEFLWNRMEAPADDELWLVRRDETWVDGRPAREALDDILHLDGWAHGPARLVRGNERPGWHRYRVEVKEAA